MPAVINTNLASLFAQQSLNQAQGSLSTSVQRLSSGLRINSAKDDASGLAIGQQMSGHIKALDQANINAQQAINLAQTADTSMSTVQDILLRMQQLAVTGANGSLSSSQRGAIVTELTNLNTQINSTSSGTTYNNIALLGTTNSVNAASTTQVGLPLGASASVGSISVSGAKAGTYTFSYAANVLTLGGGAALGTQGVALTDIAAASSGNTYNFDQLGISLTINTSSAASLAATMGGVFATKTIQVTAGAVGNLSFQVGASSSNAGDKITVSGYNIATSSGDSANMNLLGTLITGNLTTYKNSGSTDALWTTAFSSLQTNTADALNDISQQRAVLGAKMNQLAYITTNLEAQSANEKSARSTIVDTNYSAETASLTKGQILQQAATAMLAQANQMPNVILSLLK